MVFNVTIDRDEDGVFVVECPAIPGCVSQGQSKEEALENIKDAITLCLQVRSEKGMPLTIETRQGRGCCLMTSLPVISGSETVKVFERFGWTVARQTSSHI